MKTRQAIGSLFKLALLGGVAYVVLNWETISSGGSGVESFAESACVSEAKARYRLARASAYEIRRNSNGYTVRISATLSRGPAAKITCLTNPSGGVLDMTIEER